MAAPALPSDSGLSSAQPSQITPHSHLLPTAIAAPLAPLPSALKCYTVSYGKPPSVTPSVFEEAALTSPVLNLSASSHSKARAEAAARCAAVPSVSALVQQFTGSTNPASDDSDIESLNGFSVETLSSSSVSGIPELFNPAHIASKVAAEMLAQGITVKALARDLNIPNLRPMLEGPRAFADLSSIEFSSYLELLKWLKRQDVARG